MLLKNKCGSVTRTDTPISGIPRKIEAVIAGTVLVTVLPIFAVISILIKLTSRGPILFRQKRIGFGGQGFTLYKFRTMKVHQSGTLVTASTDNRITPLGKKLRSTKIDELPELWNIMRGDMSFVGPRPEVPQLVDLTNPIWREVLTARPGLTDPITLKLRNEELLLSGVADKEFYYINVLQPYKIKGYVKFLQNKCWQSDIKIIFQTIKAVILPHTAPLPTNAEIESLSKEQITL